MIAQYWKVIGIHLIYRADNGKLPLIKRSQTAKQAQHVHSLIQDVTVCISTKSLAVVPDIISEYQDF